jgi:peptidoglycan hydrolase CwlO-like protein
MFNKTKVEINHLKSGQSELDNQVQDLKNQVAAITYQNQELQKKVDLISTRLNKIVLSFQSIELK